MTMGPRVDVTGRSPAETADGDISAKVSRLQRASLAASRHRAGGQPELVPDGLLALLLAGAGVHRDDVLLAAEDVQHRIGLRVVLAEPDGKRLLGVVLAPDQ